MFAGSCIGVFLLVVASQWLARFSKEFDKACQQREIQCSVDCSSSSGSDKLGKDFPKAENLPLPIVHAVGHKWLFRTGNVSMPDHIIKSLLFTLQWGLSYLIMLLFMYYNGYIIISCILGAFLGKLAFSMNEPTNTLEEVSCCKE